MIRGMALLWAISESNNLGDTAARAVEGLQRDPAAINSTRLMLIAVGFAAVLLLVGALCCFSESRRRHAAFHSPRRLFLALVKAHRLSILDAWLLWRAASACQLEDPARLFLEPERFDPQALPRRLARHSGRLASLKNRLFAGLKEVAEAPDRGKMPDNPLRLSYNLPSPACGRGAGGEGG